MSTELEQRLDRLERLLSSFVDQRNITAEQPQVPDNFDEIRRLDAIGSALETGAYGHVMTAEGYPVRLLCGNVNRGAPKRGGGMRGDEVILGLVQASPFGTHECPEMWTQFGHRRDPRFSLVPHDGEVCKVPVKFWPVLK